MAYFTINKSQETGNEDIKTEIIPGSLVRKNMTPKGSIKRILDPYAKLFDIEDTSLTKYRKWKNCHKESVE